MHWSVQVNSAAEFPCPSQFLFISFELAVTDAANVVPASNCVQGRRSRLRKIGGLATKAKPSAKNDPMAPFSAATRRWFDASFEGPPPAQVGGWEGISSGAPALICAPAGSGKALASFLWGTGKLARSKELGTGVKL